MRLEFMEFWLVLGYFNQISSSNPCREKVIHTVHLVASIPASSFPGSHIDEGTDISGGSTLHLFSVWAMVVFRLGRRSLNLCHGYASFWTLHRYMSGGITSFGENSKSSICVLIRGDSSACNLKYSWYQPLCIWTVEK